VRPSRTFLFGPLLALAWLLPFAAVPASADHHRMKVREVFAGASGQPSAQFVELQMHAAGHNLVGDKQIVVYDSSGAVINAFTFPADLPNGANQTSILGATAQAATFFGITPDLTMTPAIPAAGGKVCYQRPTPFLVIDCVSWGNYSGSSVGTGTPFNIAGGLVLGWSALRDISGGASPTLLEGVDDTNDSAADFDLAEPTPRNNAGATTSTAGQVNVAGGTLNYVATTGSVANNVTLTPLAGGFYKLLDTGAPVTPGAGCQRLSVNEVRCSSAGVLQSHLDSGPGNDVINVSTPIPTTLVGDTGNDKLTGGNGGDNLDGGDGNDTLTGRGGKDTLNGGPLNDTLNGGPGADILDGLGGTDTATYGDRSAAQPVTIDIDDVADDGGDVDGPPGARDNVGTTVERLVGGKGADTLIGSAAPNQLTGGLGADILRGLEGNDVLIAKEGVVDAQIDCDGGATAGLADIARVDATDPTPTGCETVTM
jgi:Ca2+-binding RTX toxin-like protein